MGASSEKVDSRARLSRERVLARALAMADETGVESLSMRKLGHELGVEAMSLYNHVANKDDILDGIVDIVISEFELPDDDGDWKAAMRRSAVSANAALLRHPWASGALVVRTNTPGPARLRHMDAVLGCLREAGFSAESTHHAFHALDSHIIGFTLQQVSFPFDAEELQDLGSAFLETLPIAEYPHLAEHVVGHLDGSFAGRGGFEFGLDLILDGLERLRAEPSPT